MDEGIKIDLEELHDDVWCWYYEEFGHGEVDKLNSRVARILYDCMAVIDRAKKNNLEVVIYDDSQRP